MAEATPASSRKPPEDPGSAQEDLREVPQPFPAGPFRAQRGRPGMRLPALPGGDGVQGLMMAASQRTVDILDAVAAAAGASTRPRRCTCSSTPTCWTWPRPPPPCATGTTTPARVSYVIDRNVNYTDVCNVYCTFCAFYHKPGDARGYVLTWDQLRRKAEETRAVGGTGFLIQGGVNPDLPWELLPGAGVLPARAWASGCTASRRWRSR